MLVCSRMCVFGFLGCGPLPLIVRRAGAFFSVKRFRYQAPVRSRGAGADAEA
jgi:hypothetical protein